MGPLSTDEKKIVQPIAAIRLEATDAFDVDHAANESLPTRFQTTSTASSVKGVGIEPSTCHDICGKETRTDVREVPDQDDETREPDDDDYPDGGLQAWLVVVGGMATAASTFGYVNSWGIFQGYYAETILRNESTSNIAWIGSIQYSLMFLPSIFVGRLFDLGYYKIPYAFWSLVLIACTFIIPLCTKYWHFLLCQGFAVGLASGCMFGPTPAVIAHWFKKRRGVSMGVMAIGSSLGGTTFPVLAKSLIPKVGFPWTMRIFGFIFIGTLGVSNLLLKRRLAPRNLPGGLFNFAVFKNAAFSVYCASGFTTFMGIYTMLTYVTLSAKAIGVDGDFSFYFVAIANGASLFGRLIAGIMCDAIGPMNVMMPFTATAGILTYAWPYAQSMNSLLAVSVIYGFASGVYVSLLTNPIFELGGAGDLGRRVGMYTILLGLGGVAGPPISGAILSASGGFKLVGYYAGTMVLIGVGLMGLSRHLVLRRLVGKL